MNIKILTATALAAVLGLTSCSKDAKLADDLAGTWKSAPTAMMPDVVAPTTCRREGGDDVKLTIDASKTVVNVDTSSLTLSYAQVTDASADSLAAMKPNVASAIADILTPMLTARVNKLHEFDDVKVTGDNLTLEANDNRLTLTRQK